MLISRQLPAIFHRHVVRYVRRHPLLAALNIVSVALGVAVFYGIQLANISARASFQDSVTLVAGKASLEVRAPGGPVPEQYFPQVAATAGVAHATPLLESYATLPEHPGEYLHILGVDPFTNLPFLNFGLEDADGGIAMPDAGLNVPKSGETAAPKSAPDEAAAQFDFEKWVRDPQGIAVTQAFADKLELKHGSPLTLLIGGRRAEVRVNFIINPAEKLAEANIRVAAMDIGWAQELMQRRGELSAIQIILEREGDLPAVQARLREALPPTLTVEAPAQRNKQVQRLVGGFQLNLTALSLVSLCIGMFLIYNTVSASVVRRRRESGILRAMGVSRAELRLLFLGEAMIMGGLGIILGLALGQVLAIGLVQLVSETSATLYGVLSTARLYLRLDQALLAIAAGAASVLVGAWIPAELAAREAPIASLKLSRGFETGGNPAPLLFVAGLVTLLGAAGTSAVAIIHGPAWLGFAAAFLTLGGFSLMMPLALVGVCAGLRSGLARATGMPSRARILLRLAAENLSRALYRNAVTAAALSAAIAMLIGVNVMIHSFRQTVSVWVNQTLVADAYIAPAANEVIGLQEFMPANAAEFLRAQPGVAEVNTYREFTVPYRDGVATLAVVDARGGTLEFKSGDRAAQLTAFQQPGHVLVTEPFAERHKVRAGDAIELATPAGMRQYMIAGVYYDYTRDQGLITMTRANFLADWADPRINSLGVVLAPGMELEPVLTAFRERYSAQGEYAIYKNAELRQRVFQIFDQTFAVTYVLRSIALLVAAVGIVLSLTTLVFERQREIGVLRSLGAAGRQVQAMFLGEAGLIGVAAGGVGLAAGLALSYVLTSVINRAFFGWTIPLAFPWGALVLTPVWVLAVSLLSGLLPARQAARVPIAAAVRFE